MKRVLHIIAIIVMAATSRAQTVQFTVKAITPDTLQVYFKPDANISNVVTGISNLTFVLQIPQTLGNPQGNWVVLPNTTYLGAVSTTTATSTANGSKYNTLFSWTSNPNINGTSFIAATEYLLATVVAPSGVTSADVVAIDWGNNRIDNGPGGAPIWATSMAIDGIDRTNDLSVFYANTSTAAPLNSGGPTTASTLAITGSPLAIRNLQFTGQLEGVIANLRWQVEGELDMKSYEVEYSTDSKKWVRSNTVPAVNKEMASYESRHILDGKNTNNYFRLKMNETSGKYEYSKTINLVYIDDKAAMMLLPNAVHTGESMTLTNKGGVEGEIRIVDVTGKVIKQLNHIPTTIVTTGLSSGQYYLHINSQSSNTVLKFTVF